MKAMIWVLLLFLGTGSLWGQEVDVRKTINRIKKSNQYLSAEATLDNKEEAHRTANELLVNEINDWVKQKRNKEAVRQIVLQDISLCSEQLDMKRGSKVRVFVYVKKSDIVLIKGAGQIVLSEDEKGTDLQALSSVAGDLNLESSYDTAPHHPQADESSPAGSHPADGHRQPAVAKPAETPQQALDRIRTAQTMADMKPIFAELKRKQAITYGTYPAGGLAEVHYLLFYNRSGRIQGVVKATPSGYREVSTGEEVQLGRFSGCGAYWFVLK